MNRVNRLLILAAFVGTAQGVQALDTHSKDFANFGGWKITAEGIDGSPKTGWCRAVGQFGGNEVTILRGGLLPAYGKLFMSITIRGQTVPESYKGIANLLLDGTPAASGVIQDVGDWRGGKRTAFYSRATFPKIDNLDGKLGGAKKLTVSAAGFAKVELQGLELYRIAKELRRCLQQ